MSRFKTFPALLLTLSFLNPVQGQDGSAVDSRSTASEPSYTGSMGSVTVGGQQFYRLSMRPEIPLGQAAIALDIELFLDEKGGISDRGWAFGTSTEAFDTFLRKLYYVRYGNRDQGLYVRVGALDEVTLGYGFIMNGYRNTLQYPGIKKTGLHFQTGKTDSRLRVEGVVNNIQDFQNGGALLGLRLTGRPLGKLEVGLTYVVDIDQYGGLTDSDGDGYPDAVDAFPADKGQAKDNDSDGWADAFDVDDDNNGKIDIDIGSGLTKLAREDLRALATKLNLPWDSEVNRKNPFNKNQEDSDRFGIFGVDASYPLVQGGTDLRLYGQVAVLADDNAGGQQAKGFGIAAPGLWLKTGPLSGQIEFRHFQDDFDAGYFDNLYELDRARLDLELGTATPKDTRLLGSRTTGSGVFGRLGINLGKLVNASASYQHLSGEDDPKRQLYARARLAPELLKNIPRLRAAHAYFQKNNIGAGLNEAGDKDSSDGFLEQTEDTFYGYLIGLQMSNGVSIHWDTRYVFSRGADGQLVHDKIMSVETVFDF